MQTKMKATMTAMIPSMWGSIPRGGRCGIGRVLEAVRAPLRVAAKRGGGGGGVLSLAFAEEGALDEEFEGFVGPADSGLLPGPISLVVDLAIEHAGDEAASADGVDGAEDDVWRV